MGAEFDYRRIRNEAGEGQKPEGLPYVTKHLLTDDKGRKSFMDSLRIVCEINSLKPSSDEDLLQKALQSNIFVDQFPFMLEDLAKTRRRKDYFQTKRKEDILKKYLNLFDTFNYGTIVEYSWKADYRFVRVPDEKEFFELAFSRNYPILSREDQENLRMTKYAIGGLSVGGNIAYVLVQLGAQNFSIADGGYTDLHDLNRIAAGKVADVGVNQAIRWSKLAWELNPYLNITIFPMNISCRNSDNNFISPAKLTDGADIVIEAVDDLGAKLGLWQNTISDGKTLIMGTDLGSAAKLDVQSSGIPFHGRLTQEIMAKLADSNLSLAEKTAIAQAVVVGSEFVPSEYLESVTKAQMEGKPFWPQPGYAASLSAALVAVSEVMRLQEKSEGGEAEIMVNLKSFFP